MFQHFRKHFKSLVVYFLIIPVVIFSFYYSTVFIIEYREQQKILIAEQQAKSFKQSLNEASLYYNLELMMSLDSDKEKYENSNEKFVANKDAVLKKIAAQQEKYVLTLSSGLGRWGGEVDDLIYSAINSIDEMNEINNYQDFHEYYNKIQMNLDDKIISAINIKVFGYTRPGMKSEDQFIRFVSDAILAMQKNPNDSKLCSAMASGLDFDELDLLDLDGAKIDKIKNIAQKAAFITAGKKYCSNYYTKPDSWGLTNQKNNIATSQYEGLSYQEYYSKYVVPLVVGKKDRIKNAVDSFYDTALKDINSDASGDRNPDADALHEMVKEMSPIFLEKLKQNKFITLSSKAFERTNSGWRYKAVLTGWRYKQVLICLKSSKKYNKNTIEYCKEELGVLFKN